MSNIHVIELNEYTRPEVHEQKNRDWVSIGDNNNFFGYLIDRYLNSPTNGTIINSITSQVYGKGLNAYDASKMPDEFAQMKSLFKKQDLKNAILDFEIMGMAALQVTYKGKRISKVGHFPMQTLRPEKMDEKGNIKAWYYHNDWPKAKRTDKPERIPVFGSGASNEIYIIKRYVSGMDYFSLPPYFSSVSYMELEESISAYLLNTVQNGFSSSKILSFNNGTPDRQTQLEIKNKVVNQLTGVYGEKVIVSFNNSKEQAPEVIDLPLDNAAEQYAYLSEECSRKIMIGHRVTSPLLLGLRDGNSSLGSNADEIVNASRLFNNITIRPIQDQITEALDDILAVNGISLDLYFKTLEPLEFKEANQVITQEQEEKADELELSQEFNDEDALKQLEGLGEDEEALFTQGWELVDERKADIEKEDALDAMLSLASVVPNKATAKSDLDGETESGKRFMVRYQYAPLYVGKNTRDFCKRMVKAKKVYRREDLDKESAANTELSPSGSTTYNIFKYKGGANCGHYFQRKTYLLKDGIKPDPNSPNAKPVYKNQRKKEGINEPSLDKEPAIVSQRPIERADRGYKNPR